MVRRRSERAHVHGRIPVVNQPDVTVIVRARDEEQPIARCLAFVDAQRTGSLEVEKVVVDNGSIDRTVELAAASGARVVSIPAAAFSFGAALNLGAANARGRLLVALSADAFVPDRDWLARLAEAFSDDRVACASGDRFSPEGRPLRAPVRQDVALARRHPGWGYSNGAGAFRAELWRRRAFREDLPGCEDQEWALHWLGEGYVCVVDPALVVDHDHSHDSLPDIYRRARREAHGIAMFVDMPPYGPRDLIREWWSDDRFYDSRLRARLSHRRLARLLGASAGRRRADGTAS